MSEADKLNAGKAIQALKDQEARIDELVEERIPAVKERVRWLEAENERLKKTEERYMLLRTRVSPGLNKGITPERIPEPTPEPVAKKEEKKSAPAKPKKVVKALPSKKEVKSLAKRVKKALKKKRK